MTKQEIQTAIKNARTASARAESVRARLRRKSKPGAALREDELAVLVNELHVVMGPLRSLIGRLPYHEKIDPKLEKELRAASELVKYQRKQIRKMQRR